VLRIHNTLSKRLEVFEPLEPPFVKMYYCGPTVYDYTHVGHARAIVVADIIKRYLTLRGYDVFLVQNITDIDDKIIKRAIEEGRSWRDVADEFTKDYFEALKALNANPDIHPRVSDHIDDIIKFIEGLIEKGYAYVAKSGSVYFDVEKFIDYGKLSGRVKGPDWRQEEEYLSEKKSPYDFALWKAAKPGEPWWESPWGKGRPGWHIECSVMSSKYLGPQFDIHGGGQDLIFPHHENEIAQSEAFFGKKPWVRYWIHHGMVTINKEKMSKSLGNIVTLRELFKRVKPEVVRLWVLSAHYRSTQEFSYDVLEQYSRLFERLVRATQILRHIIKEESECTYLSDEELKVMREIRRIRSEFYSAMDNDFNTPQALRALTKLISLVFKEIEPKSSKTLALKAYGALMEFNHVFGVLDRYLSETPEEITKLVYGLINLIVKIRQKHRKIKDYETADWIRAELLKLGIQLMDSKEGTKWVIKIK